MWPWLYAESAKHDIRDAYLPKISIITPSYNQGQYLEETIRSVIAQDYPRYELIIIDAGSTDNTLDVIRQYEPWITYWVSEKDRGQSHAIQKGLAQVTGDIVNWINSDDLLAPGAFYSLAREFDLAHYDVLCGGCDYFLNDISQLDTRGMRMGLDATVGDTLNRHQINQPSTFFKASILKQLGVDEQFRYTMDLDLWFRYLLQAGQEKVLLSDSLLTYFRLHEASKTVAEGTHFEQDIQRVFYNVLYSTGQPAVLLDAVRQLIVEKATPFVPTRYPVRVPKQELAAFVRHQAWLAVHRYNDAGHYAAARACLAIARQHGFPLNWVVLKQLIRLYVLPQSLLRH
ncbi:glycosyltransferase [Hymenobacter sp. BT186]|uniref:Glycosyltransferase n=1 Tax=Hymenobacter telluris TaxID=2816474 RepID=A0A939J9T4_9BACT|nr:glycosyltransferase family 2 protein [Hymenobacter telluris]MBO0357371.1 glycosyltransferase [Hymenobacter telluris]MBW3373397.1 glycosyltransferase [Hymenobacter norwichensis]